MVIIDGVEFEFNCYMSMRVASTWPYKFDVARAPYISLARMPFFKGELSCETSCIISARPTEQSHGKCMECAVTSDCIKTQHQCSNEC